MILVICPKCKKPVNSMGGVPPKICNYCGAEIPPPKTDKK